MTFSYWESELEVAWIRIPTRLVSSQLGSTYRYLNLLEKICLPSFQELQPDNPRRRFLNRPNRRDPGAGSSVDGAVDGPGEFVSFGDELGAGVGFDVETGPCVSLDGEREAGGDGLLVPSNELQGRRCCNPRRRCLQSDQSINQSINHKCTTKNLQNHTKNI